jgi:hypothetical protein
VEALELEIVQVVAELETDHPRAQRAVLLRTKSVTAAHRRGLVPVLAAEDLAAAAAETTREPAATEAAGAWVAVVSAVGAVAVDAVAVDAVAVDAAAAEAEEAEDAAAAEDVVDKQTMD